MTQYNQSYYFTLQAKLLGDRSFVRVKLHLTNVNTCVKSFENPSIYVKIRVRQTK